MGNENDHVLIYTTFSNVDEAKKVGVFWWRHISQLAPIFSPP
jgi:hypothetical protein